jgi:hypothetical protein
LGLKSKRTLFTTPASTGISSENIGVSTVTLVSVSFVSLPMDNSREFCAGKDLQLKLMLKRALPEPWVGNATGMLA